jgi:salicylate hydroxylase
VSRDDPGRSPRPSPCILTEEAFAVSPAIQFWGGFETSDVNKYNKIVMAPCNGGQIISFYCFFPVSVDGLVLPARDLSMLTPSSPHTSQSELSTTSKEGFNVSDIPLTDLLTPFSQLDSDCLRMLQSSIDRKPWRLYEHTPLRGWVKGRTGLLGDACHAMFPHQSQYVMRIPTAKSENWIDPS